MREVNGHGNILKLFEVYETSHNIFLCMEYISGGNLEDLINQESFFPASRVRKIMKEIFEGLSNIHSKNIMHRDIKPSNILIKEDKLSDFEIIIADFGLATPCDVKQYLLFKCGTLGFVAPEILLNNDQYKKYDSVCDVFSAGAIFHKLLLIFPIKNLIIIG